MLRRAPALRHAGVVFIRKTATRARRDGGSYTSFRLVESVRSGSQVSQRTLLNLGSGFAVPPERWPELVLLVESLRSGQACLLEPDPALLGEAERIAEALRPRGLDAPAEQAIAVHLDAGRRPHGPSLFRTRGPRLARRLLGDPRAARPGTGQAFVAE